MTFCTKKTFIIWSMIYEIEFLGHYNVILNSGVGGAFKL